MSNGRHPNLRAALALFLVYTMVWAGVPAPALAQTAEESAETAAAEGEGSPELEEDEAEPLGQELGQGMPQSMDQSGAQEPSLDSVQIPAQDSAQDEGGSAAQVSTPSEAAGPDAPEGGPSTPTAVATAPRATLDGDASNEDLLRSYVQQELDEAIPHEASLSAQSAYEGLSELDALVFDALAPLIAEVARGDRASTEFQFAANRFANTQGWTAQDLGVDAIVVGGQITSEATDAATPRVVGDVTAIMQALIRDLPSELYWFDKTAGMDATNVGFSANWVGGEWVLVPTGTFSYRLSVAQEYATGSYAVDTALGRSVQTAIASAQGIVRDNEGKSILDRLQAYRTAICNEVSYNRPAADNDDTPYGNPWQLVWVFDRDDSTNVVCEGYAKAFKYLCDLTWPDRGDVECLLATGMMSGGTGAGRHMWNVVRMDDGNNYLVDVTNCDEGTVGAPDQLFLAPKASGTCAEGYAFVAGGRSVLYEYDDETMAAFGEDALTISDAAYDPQWSQRVGAPVAADGLVYDGTEQTGVASGRGYTLSGASATNAGEHTATATLAEGFVWADGTTAPKAIPWSIARRPVTVTADDKTKRVGEDDPELTATVEGTVGEDAVSYTLFRVVGDEAGSYAIAPVGATAQGNYEVTFVSGTLTIITVTASGTWGTCPWEITSDGTLTVRPGVGESQDGAYASPWAGYNDSISRVVLEGGGTSRVKLPRNSQSLFASLTAVTSMDLSGADASDVTDMNSMFYYCISLRGVSLPGWVTSKVTDIRWMFDYCHSLVSVDGISGWDTSSVTSLFALFYECSALASLDLSGWNTSSVTDMQVAFMGCRSLQALDLSGWDTSSVTDATSMFYGCSPATVRVGAGYAMTGTDMFPESGDDLQWRSEATGEFYDSAQIVATRSGRADTYTQQRPGAIVSGTWGTCPWEITSDGTLVVRPGVGTSTNTADAPWLEHASEINKVVFASEGGRKVTLTGSAGSLFKNLENVTEMDLSGFDTSGVTSMRSMFHGCSSLASLDLFSWEISKVTDIRWMFYGCSSLATLDLSGWDASSVTDMTAMFHGCSSLASLDLSSWDTSSVTDMRGMFGGCSSLASLDLSGWDTSLVTNMDWMFSSCSSLVSLDLSDWETPRVTDMRWMFHGCSSLASLDLSGWDTSSVTHMTYMFDGCSSLATLDLSGWDTSQVSGMYGMFYGCSSLASLDLSGFVTSSVTNTTWMFYGCSSLASLDASGWDTSQVTDMGYMFDGCSSLASLDLSSWDTSSVTDMRGMFAGCSSLASLDLSDWNTSSVTYMGDMFSGCTSLASLDLSGWDTSSVTNGAMMFQNCSSLAWFKVGSAYEIKSPYMVPDATATNGMWWSVNEQWWYLKNDIVANRSCTADTYEARDTERCWGTCPWEITSDGTLVVRPGVGTSTNTADAPWLEHASEINKVVFASEGGRKVTLTGSAANLFKNLENVTEMDLSGFDTSGVTSMSGMFSGCSSLASLDISDWDTSAVVYMSVMFADCSSLTNLDLSEWSVPLVKSMTYMFSGCTSLVSLDVSGWDTSSVANMGSMFSGCSSLASLDLSGWDTSQVTDMRSMFDGCSSLASLDVSGFNTSSVTDMGAMFYGCSSLVFLDASNWVTSSVTNMSLVFSHCSSLTALDLSGWDTSSVTNGGSMFYNCTSLAWFKVGQAYEIKSRYMVPDATTTNRMWWSVKDQAWYTTKTIADNRSGVADSYANYSCTSIASIYGATVTFGQATYEYAGTAQFPIPTVILDGSPLEPGVDFVCRYANNRDVGTATVTIVGTGAYEGSLTGSFQIAKAPLTVRANDQAVVYGDAAPDYGVTYEGLRGTDTASSLGGTLQCVCDYAQYDDAGSTFAITPSGLTSGNYNITFAPGTLTVVPRPVTLAWGATRFTYDGSPHVPTATARDLVNGDSATVTVVGAETCAGTYVAAATSVSNPNYCPPEQNTREFTIAKASISPTVSIEGWTYGDAAKSPTMVGNHGGGTVSYTYAPQGSSVLEYKSEVPVNAGRYSVRAVVAETDNYLRGEAFANFEIAKAGSQMLLAPTPRSLTYNGRIQTLVTAGVASGGTMLYCTDRVAWSTYIPTATGAGSYSVWYKVLGDLNHSDYVGASPIAVTIDKAENTLTVAQGPTLNVGGTFDLSALVSRAVGGVTYSISSAPEGCSVNEITGVFTAGSKGGTCEVSVIAAGDANHEPATKEISVLVRPSVGNASVTFPGLEDDACAYDGSVKTPAVRVTIGEDALGADCYSVEYENNVGVGTATARVTGRGGYSGSTSATFRIVPASISGATIAPIRGRGYDGTPYEPKPKITLGGRTLVEGTDYELSYANNVYSSNGNLATLTATGVGNYTGTATARFEVWKNGQPMTAWAVARQAPAASLATRDVTVEAPIHVAHAVSAAKPMEYRKKSGDSRLNVDLYTGRVTIRKGTPVGTYKVTIRAIAFGGSNYADGSRTVECAVKVVSGKIDQDFQVTAADVTRTASSLAGADYLTRPFSVAMATGNVTYKRVDGSSCLDVDSAGRLRVLRGTRVGTYGVNVRVTAAGDAGYKPCTREATVKVVVK